MAREAREGDCTNDPDHHIQLQHTAGGMVQKLKGGRGMGECELDSPPPPPATSAMCLVTTYLFQNDMIW